MTWDRRTTLREVYEHPVGHDVLAKLAMQLCLGEGWFTGPLGRMRLGAVERLAGRRLGDGFIPMLLTLLNGETARLEDEEKGEGWPSPWWRDAVFYQIYPRSFCHGGEGKPGKHHGDLKGILSRLDDLKALGVDALWLSPIYDSPDDDNGYDIRDYEKIDPRYGTLADFDALLKAVHDRGMRLIMDLVVNHTSDEHAWFQAAQADPNAPERKFYFLREGEAPPNNWTSFFSGSAWRSFEEQNQWGLHLFSPKQMDLNWDNPALRQRIIDMVNRWLDRGVDGFRLDVINYISKATDLPDGNPLVGKLMGFTGVEHYFYGPRLHEYLSQLHREAFGPHGAFSVGETPGIGMKMGELLTAPSRGELDMIFNFDILEPPGKARFDIYRFDPFHLKRHLMAWSTQYRGWNAIFFDNHDNPRMVSKIDPDGKHREGLAKLLLTLQCTLPGTPFLYQGSEIGAGNITIASPHDFDDIESINKLRELEETLPPEEAFAQVAAGSRDHARAMMDWDEVDRQKAREGSVWRYARQLIALRRQNAALRGRAVKFLEPRRRDAFDYLRGGGEQGSFCVVCNLTEKPQRRRRLPQGEPVLSTCSLSGPVLAAYEARIYRWNEGE